MNEIHVQPLRNMVLGRLENGKNPSQGLVVIHPERAVCRFYVLAIGPEVRDIHVGQTILANRLTGTQIQGDYLIPDTAVVGYL